MTLVGTHGVDAHVNHTRLVLGGEDHRVFAGEQAPPAREIVRAACAASTSALSDARPVHAAASVSTPHLAHPRPARAEHDEIDLPAAHRTQPDPDAARHLEAMLAASAVAPPPS